MSGAAGPRVGQESETDRLRHLLGEQEALALRYLAERDRLRNDLTAMQGHLEIARQIGTEKADEVARLRDLLEEIAHFTRELPASYVHVLAMARGA